MKIIKKIFFNLILISFLYSCGASDAAKVLKNEKITNTDEFLIKKRDPLVLPPDYDNLPKPNSVKKTKNSDSNKIDKILNLPEENSSTNTGNSSLEESIMKSIRK